MAISSQRARDLRATLICPLCREYFTDPVILQCEHNFCRACIARHCAASQMPPSCACPQCGARFPEGGFQSNPQLRNVVEIAKKILDPKGIRACEEHKELLKLFCEVDQTPICLVCRETPTHREHSVVPIEEAALDYQDQIQSRLESLKKEREEILLYKSSGENTSEELLDIKDTLARCEREKFQNPVAFSSELKWRIWESSQRNASVETIMKKFKDLLSSRQRLDKVNVTLDPDTAHPRLILSADRKSVRWGCTQQALPDNPERFDTEFCVLGCEGFTSGRHYWEVEVEMHMEDWGLYVVGVARESVSRKGGINFNPEQGIWAVQGSKDQYRALTSPVQIIPLFLSRAPSRIRVYLDCEEGRVMFFDAGNGDPIVTFPPASFAGERIRPFFWAGVTVRLL
ncbi:Tripartite motif-containing protein 10 [Platysternon megacephalum]|uniref:Tripartite motif-containing protein 10 n=1 Tax=Platysternon megacephalum TaxID=55544 RepID=A0A4D9DND1_9SAUR|nr:Tripartite motif-containing protein 10 [Platysternon megacephalum]